MGNSGFGRWRRRARWKIPDMDRLFRNRTDAGRRRATALEGAALGDAVVVGLARGEVPVAPASVWAASGVRRACVANARGVRTNWLGRMTHGLHIV
jgi:hypothetical protein